MFRPAATTPRDAPTCHVSASTSDWLQSPCRSSGPSETCRRPHDAARYAPERSRPLLERLAIALRSVGENLDCRSAIDGRPEIERRGGNSSQLVRVVKAHPCEPRRGFGGRTVEEFPGELAALRNQLVAHIQHGLRRARLAERTLVRRNQGNVEAVAQIRGLGPQGGGGTLELTTQLKQDGGSRHRRFGRSSANAAAPKTGFSGSG